jgi:repressor LexA
MSVSMLIRRAATLTHDLEPVPFDPLEGGGVVAVPLLGTITAGLPIDIHAEQESVELPSAWVTKNQFALRVRGHSMIDDNIQDGDIIVVRQQISAENGETVVAQINGEQATLKRLFIEADGVRLQPANEAMEPIFLRHEEVEILGIVQVIIRKPRH